MMQRRILLLYRGLKRVEEELDERLTDQRTASLAGQVDQLEAKANRLRVPLTLSQNLYHLKAHVRLVRDRVAEASAAASVRAAQMQPVTERPVRFSDS
jgi:hypothetical protein